MIHRDDMDMDDAESIVKMLQEKHPGMKVVFAGDAASPEQEEKSRAIHLEMARRFIDGRCHTCNAKMPGKWDEEDCDLADGWEYFESIGDEPMGMLECPTCGSDPGPMRPITGFDNPAPEATT